MILFKYSTIYVLTVLELIGMMHLVLRNRALKTFENNRKNFTLRTPNAALRDGQTYTQFCGTDRIKF